MSSLDDWKLKFYATNSANWCKLTSTSPTAPTRLAKAYVDVTPLHMLNSM